MLVVTGSVSVKEPGRWESPWKTHKAVKVTSLSKFAEFAEMAWLQNSTHNFLPGISFL